MKRIIAVFLVALVVFASLPVFTVPTKASDVPDGLTYKFNTLKTSATITGYTGKKNNLEIPSEIEGVPVTSIGFEAFYYNNYVSAVLLPETITNISASAFSHCRNLKMIVLPKSLKTISSKAFESIGDGLSLLYCGTKDEWENDVNKVSSAGIDNANIVYDFEPIKYDNLLCSVNNGEATVYRYLGPDYSSATIPSEIEGCPVTAIADYAFYIGFDAYSIFDLKTLTIPDTVTYIGKDAFEGSCRINTLYINDLASWCNIEFENSYSNPLHCSRNLYVDGEICKRDIIFIPDGVKRINDYAFYGWYAYSYYIPESVEYIGEQAFYVWGMNKDSIYYQGTSDEWKEITGGREIFEDDPMEQSPALCFETVYDRESGFIYTITKEYRARIYDYYGSDTTVVIPRAINGSPVEIRTAQFLGQNGVKVVYFDGTKKEFSDMFYSIEGCQSFINNHVVVFTPVPIEGFVLAGGVDSVTVEIGETFEPVYEVYPENANGVFTYSFNSDCISINKGVITGEAAGEATVTVTSESGVTYSFTVKVIGCVGIEIESLPEKIYYSTRQPFDPSGLKIVKLYNDGTAEECTDYTMSSYNSLKKGVQTITVTSGAFTTSFNVFVSGALVGDTDLDGKLTAIDSNYMKRTIAGERHIEEMTDSFFACDLNGDGKLNAMDSALLKRSLAG